MTFPSTPHHHGGTGRLRQFSVQRMVSVGVWAGKAPSCIHNRLNCGTMAKLFSVLSLLNTFLGRAPLSPLWPLLQSMFVPLVKFSESGVSEVSQHDCLRPYLPSEAACSALLAAVLFISLALTNLRALLVGFSAPVIVSHQETVCLKAPTVSSCLRRAFNNCLAQQKCVASWVLFHHRVVVGSWFGCCGTAGALLRSLVASHNGRHGTLFCHSVVRPWPKNHLTLFDFQVPAFASRLSLFSRVRPRALPWPLLHLNTPPRGFCDERRKELDNRITLHVAAFPSLVPCGVPSLASFQLSRGRCGFVGLGCLGNMSFARCHVEVPPFFFLGHPSRSTCSKLVRIRTKSMPCSTTCTSTLLHGSQAGIVLCSSGPLSVKRHLSSVFLRTARLLVGLVLSCHRCSLFCCFGVVQLNSAAHQVVFSEHFSSVCRSFMRDRSVPWYRVQELQARLRLPLLPSLISTQVCGGMTS